MFSWIRDMYYTWNDLYGYYLLIYMNKLLDRFTDHHQKYYSTQYIDWCKELRHNYLLIKKEYLDYISYNDWQRFRDVDPVQFRVDTGDIPWGIIILRLYNKDTMKLRLFPETHNLLKMIPHCTTAMISILPPNKKIPIHCGPYKGVLRYHLGLIVPNQYWNCSLYVNKHVYHWQEGQDLIFDDTFPHLVHNNTDQYRVILFLDIQRRFDNPIINIINRCFLYYTQFNSTVKSIVRRVDQFESR